MRFTILILGDFLSLPHNTIGFSDEQRSVKLYKFEHNDFMAKQIFVVKFYAVRQKKASNILSHSKQSDSQRPSEVSLSFARNF